MPSKHVRYIGTVIFFLVIASVACNFNLGETKLESVTMARDEQGKNPTTTFASDDDFFVVFDLKNAPNDTKIRTVWYAVAVDGLEPNTQLGEQEIETGSGASYFSLANAQRNTLWGLGKYRAEVYVDGDKAEILEFIVNVQLDEAYLSTDEGGAERNAVFPPDATIYANVEVKDAPENEATLSITWYRDETVLFTEEVPAGTGGSLSFSFDHEGLFDLGSYHVDIAVDDEVQDTLSFSITVQILNQYLAKQPESATEADTFYLGETPYVILDVAPSPENDVTAEAIWYVAGEEGRIEAGTTQVAIGTGGLVTLEPPSDLEFVEGRYIVEVFEGQARLASLRFSFEPLPDSPFAGG